MRHILDLTDLSAAELTTVLDLAEAPVLPPVLTGSAMGVMPCPRFAWPP